MIVLFLVGPGFEPRPNSTIFFIGPGFDSQARSPVLGQCDSWPMSLFASQQSKQAREKKITGSEVSKLAFGESGDFRVDIFKHMIQHEVSVDQISVSLKFFT